MTEAAEVADLKEQVRVVMQRMGEVVQEVTIQKARADASEARADASEARADASEAQLAQVKTELVEAKSSEEFLEKVTEVVSKGFGRKNNANIVVGKSGVGKPVPFKNDPQKWREWSGKLTNYMCATLGEGQRTLLDFIAEQEKPIRICEIDEDLWDHLNGSMAQVSEQVYHLLVHMTEEESYDIMTASHEVKGNGLEAWRKLAKRWSDGFAAMCKACSQALQRRKSSLRKHPSQQPRWSSCPRTIWNEVDDRSAGLRKQRALWPSAMGQPGSRPRFWMDQPAADEDCHCKRSEGIHQ